MAQIFTNLTPNKQEGDTLSAEDLNTINQVVDHNALDVSGRLGAIEPVYEDLDQDISQIESQSSPISAYYNQTLPSANLSEISFYLVEQQPIYYKKNAWHRFKDNTEVIVLKNFILKIDTTKEGITPDDQFSLELNGVNANVEIDWGDGSEIEFSRIEGSTISHTYPNPGEYTIHVINITKGIKFSNNSDRLKVIEILQFGDLAFDSNSQRGFYGCSNMNISATDAPDTSINENFTLFFTNCNSTTSIPAIDTSKGTTFLSFLQNCSGVTSLPNFDLSAATDAQAYRSSFQGLHLITNLDNITFGNAGANMRSAFHNCRSLVSLPSINTQNVTTFENTCNNCHALESFPSGDVMSLASATNFIGTWSSCSSLSSFPLTSMSNARDLTNSWRNCSSITSFPEIHFSAGVTFVGTWVGCSSLTDFPYITLGDGSEETSFEGAWSDCALSAQSIENIMRALVDNGLSNLVTSVAGGTSVKINDWTPAAIEYRNTLLSRGWTVHTNVD